MSKSLFQDTAVLAILCSIERGNNARGNFDGRKLKNFKYREECPVYYGNYTRRPKGRADLCVEITYDKNNQWELTEDYIFECKSSVDDLHSGCGLNFCGDRNFIVIPDYSEADLYKKCPWKLTYEVVEDYLKEKGLPGVGILILKSEKIICKKMSWADCDYGWLFQTAFGDYYDQTTSD